ncbi:MAG TPA: hypothetical protein VNA25_26110 [Phycisphaerae bacterium]|nr:hypothetical protein [Phycisphaerae bacterium]
MTEVVSSDTLIRRVLLCNEYPGPGYKEKMKMTAPNEIDRVRQDLETVRQAAGISLPFGREDVVAELLMAGGLAIFACVSLFVTGLWVLLSLAPFLGTAVVSLVWLRARYRRRSGRSPVRRREYTAALTGGLLATVLLLSFHWSGLAHANRDLVYAAFACGWGVGFLMAGIADTARRGYVVAAIVALAIGLGIVFFHETRAVSVVAGASTLGLCTDAAVTIHVLRRGRAAV